MFCKNLLGALFVAFFVLTGPVVFARDLGSSIQKAVPKATPNSSCSGFMGGAGAMGCGGGIIDNGTPAISPSSGGACGMAGYGCLDNSPLGIATDPSFWPCHAGSMLLGGDRPKSFKATKSGESFYIEAALNKKGERVGHWYFDTIPGKEACMENVERASYLSGVMVIPSAEGPEGYDPNKYEEIMSPAAALSGVILRVTVSPTKEPNVLALHYQIQKRDLKKIAKIPHGLQHPVYSGIINVSGDLLMDKTPKKVKLPNGDALFFLVREAKL